MSTHETKPCFTGDEDYTQRLLRPLYDGEITVDKIWSYPLTEPAREADLVVYPSCITDKHARKIIHTLGMVAGTIDIYSRRHEPEFIGGYNHD